MSGVTDEDQLAALRDIAGRLLVDLGDKRAGGVVDDELARRRLALDGFGDAVGAENGDGVRRDLGEVFDEARAFGLQPVDDMLVVDDLMPNIDRARRIS